MRRLQINLEGNVRRTGLFLSAFLLLVAGAVSAQTNLLLNPGGDNGASNWIVSGEATVEESNGEGVFVIRRGADSTRGGFTQTVKLTPADVGKFALLIGFGSSERVNADGAITGLPYLYGYMLEVNNPTGGKINAYLQGQQMRANPVKANQWVKMYGVFEVPEKTVAIQFMLDQASRRGVPLNGSAARFDNVGLYLFKTEAEAIAFARDYQFSHRFLTVDGDKH